MLLTPQHVESCFDQLLNVMDEVKNNHRRRHRLRTEPTKQEGGWYPPNQAKRRKQPARYKPTHYSYPSYVNRHPATSDEDHYTDNDREPITPRLEAAGDKTNQYEEWHDDLIQTTFWASWKGEMPFWWWAAWGSPPS